MAACDDLAAHLTKSNAENSLMLHCIRNFVRKLLNIWKVDSEALVITYKQVVCRNWVFRTKLNISYCPLAPNLIWISLANPVNPMFVILQLIRGRTRNQNNDSIKNWFLWVEPCPCLGMLSKFWFLVGQSYLKMNHICLRDVQLHRGRGTVTVRSPVTGHPTLFRGFLSRLEALAVRGALKVNKR